MNAGDRVRCAIHDDPNASALQELKVYVAGSLVLTSTAIDNDWSAGLCGLIVMSGAGTAQTFDNFKVGYDNNADDDCDDAGDDVQIDDSFGSNVINLTYDNVGNLTDDGIFLYTLDGWNRVVKATRREDALTTVATYAFDGLGRLAARVFRHSGVEQVANDGGDTTVHNYYDARKPLETRNGSNQVTFQMVWGTQNQRELVLYEKNGDPTAANDNDPDVTTTGESSESPADQRWFVASDRTGRVTAKTEYDTGGTNNGRVTERYDRNLLASSGSIIRGDSGNGEAGVVEDFPDNGGPQPALPWFPDPPQVVTLPYGGGGQPGGSNPANSSFAYRWRRVDVLGANAFTTHLGMDVASTIRGWISSPGNPAGPGCSTPAPIPNAKYFHVDFGAPPNMAGHGRLSTCNGRMSPDNYAGQHLGDGTERNLQCDNWHVVDTEGSGIQDSNCFVNCLAESLPRYFGPCGTYNEFPIAIDLGNDRGIITTINNSNSGIAAAKIICNQNCSRTGQIPLQDPPSTYIVAASGWGFGTQNTLIAWMTDSCTDFGYGPISIVP